MVTKIENNVDNPIAQVIFAHGAGADMHHEFMVKITDLFNQANINVLRFNFPYMDKRIALGKRYPPDRMPKLISCFEEVMTEFNLNNSRAQLPLFIGGKSMGSRVAATLANDEEYAKLILGVFCFGYPFHPPKKVDKLRLEPLQNTLRPILIAQGERDTLGSKEEILGYNIASLCHCHFLSDGDHSLKPRVKSGYTHSQHMEKSVQIITQFIQENINNE